MEEKGGVGSKKKRVEPPFLLGEEIELSIDSLAVGGSGVGRYQGFVVFVPLTCPGDQVKVRLSLIKKNFAEADLLQVIHSSSKRVEAPCSVFSDCGGCSWQHISYEEQLQQKQLIVEQTFKKKKFRQDDFHLRKTVPSPKPFRYRNRIQLKVDSEGHGGFYARKSHRIIDIDDCLIAEEKICQKLPDLKRKNHSLKEEQHREIEIYLSQKGEVATGDTSEMGFSQVNQSVNEILIKDVLTYLKKYGKKEQTVYDLYCGHGNFSFPIFEQFKEVVGVELSLASVESARQKVRDQGLSSLHVIHQDVGKFLRNCTGLQGPVLLDPPRVGCQKEVIQSLKELHPPVILYVSCNPQTLVRDLELLGIGSQYRIEEICPYDMFPQTDHVEILTVLTRV